MGKGKEIYVFILFSWLRVLEILLPTDTVGVDEAQFSFSQNEIRCNDGWLPSFGGAVAEIWFFLVCVFLRAFVYVGSYILIFWSQLVMLSVMFGATSLNVVSVCNWIYYFFLNSYCTIRLTTDIGWMGKEMASISKEILCRICKVSCRDVSHAFIRIDCWSLLW